MLNIGKSESGVVSFDLPTLIDTRLLIQSNSGGGKSYAIRRLLEQSHGRIQQIVLDREGEFPTLREKYDYIIAGKDGDVPVSMQAAKLLARHLLEQEVSAICDLYELKAHDRVRFVRLFLESLMSAPKALWHPVLVVVDEAHDFAPEKGQAESHQAVIDLATRGRKRGFCAVLATQRLSKLHKDACAELLNKMIGRTSLDIDQSRAADELGIIGKQDRVALRNLQPGEFHVYGPALNEGGQHSNDVIKIKVGSVKTTHPKVGARRLGAPPKPTPKIRKILQKLTDLPAEAEQEAQDVASLKRANADLRRRLTMAEKVQPATKPCNHDGIIHQLESQVQAYQALGGSFLQSYGDISKHLKNIAAELDREFKDLTAKYEAIPKRRATKIEKRMEIRKPQIVAMAETTDSPDPENDKPVRGGARRMLEVLASRHGEKTTKSQLGTLSRVKKTGGTFGTYQSRLLSRGLIEISNGNYSITDAGFEFLGTTFIEPKSSEEIQEMWRERLSGGALRMFDHLIAIYPNEISKEELAAEANISMSGGSWRTYLSRLRGNDLIEINNGMLRANETLFE